jgi:integrase/recombinase XerD
MSDLVVASITQANTDEKIIEMWLHGRPKSTAAEYRRDIAYFRRFLECKPLRELTLEDLQAYQSHLDEKGLGDSTKKRKLNAVKSLFTFATKLNYTRFNVAAALRLPKAPRTLAGRILKQSEVFKMSAAADEGRNNAFILLMYGTGARVSEVCQLRWQDFSEREDGAVQVSYLGKGEKYRTVLVPESVWAELKVLRGQASAQTPVFQGYEGKPISRKTGHRIVKSAVERAKLNPNVSCHWLRHAHGQHAIVIGKAPLHLVRDTLGHSSISVTNLYLESNPEDSSSRYLGL